MSQAVVTALRAAKGPKAARTALEWLWRHQTDGLVEAYRSEIVSTAADVFGCSTVRINQLLTMALPDMRRGLKVRAGALAELLPCSEPFPSDGWLGAWRLYTQGGEAPLGYGFWAGVAVLAAAMRRNFYWDMGKYWLYPNQYIVLLGPSGLKKTTSIEASVEIVNKLNEGFELDAEMIAHQLFISPQRITPERLVEKMASLRGVDLSAASQGRNIIKQLDAVGLLVADELVTLLGKNVKGADRMVHFLTAIYGCPKSYSTSTVTNKDKYLINVAMSTLFGSTETWVRTSITEDMFGGGFLARFMMVYRTLRERKISVPEPLDPVLASALADWLRTWTAIPFPIELVRSEGAEKWYDRWYQSQEPEKAGEREAGFANRKHDHLHKLAGLLKISALIGPDVDPNDLAGDGQVQVEVENFERALAIIEAEEERWPELYASVGSNEDARVVEFVWQRLVQLQEAQPQRTWFPQSLIMRLVRSRIGTGAKLRQTLATLETEGRLELKWSRPASVRVIPAVEYEE